MKKRYALIGCGSRAEFFYGSLVKNYKETSELAAICDTNQTRMNVANRYLVEKHGYHAVPTYKAQAVEQMIQEQKPDTVIVTTVDRTHHLYIIRALEMGCDVITEKPMTTDEEKCQAILDAVERTRRKVRVTFNYRYAPHNTKLRELVMEGVIGDVHSVHFEWLLNTEHGADYFRRWHRDKVNSGGLLVHKSTHHFDLVNFWLGTTPKRVFAMGGLRFYGKANAEQRGVTEFYQRAHGSEAAKNDPFALHMKDNSNFKSMYLDAEHEDGYMRDQSVFGDGISIEDTLGVMVDYQNNAILTYSLNAYMPWEGFSVALNGSKGRIEMKVVEKSYVNGGGDKANEGALQRKSIHVFPMFAESYEVKVEEQEGGHGGGDPLLLHDLFGEPAIDQYNRAADHVDGAMSILTGIAGNIALRTGQAVEVEKLVQFHN